MKADYSDLIDVINQSGKAIKWFDRNGVPRTDEFSPSLCAPGVNLITLVEAYCQLCEVPFLMEHSIRGNPEQVKQEIIRLRSSFANTYDPPANIIHSDDCCSGASMTSMIKSVKKVFIRSVETGHWEEQDPTKY